MLDNAPPGRGTVLMRKGPSTMNGNPTIAPNEQLQRDIQSLCGDYARYNSFDPALYSKYGVKRGLRNADGTGVVAGITQICNVHGYILNEGERCPIDGELVYRGINIRDIISGCQADGRYSWEETAWLLLMGSLPTGAQLVRFTDVLSECRALPENFTEDMIMKVASPNIMTMLSRSLLALSSYDPAPEDTSVENVLRQSVQLIARMPAIMAASYQVKRRVYDGRSMYLHNPNPEFSTAQNILRLLRSDKQFTDEEARLLDLCLTLHSEHGGGNNSTFAVRLLTSSGTDTYSAISAGIGSLKGPRHGGASAKVIEQLEYLKANVYDWEDDGQIRDYLRRALNREAGDRSGLIYGMGHAVYTKSDPRCKILKENALRMAKGTDFEGEFRLLDAVERLAPELLQEKWGSDRSACANVDLYSGLVYRMLRIPDELHTPMFAIARTAGWCAHRLEEIGTCNKIIRPAYKPISKPRAYLPIAQRG